MATAAVTKDWKENVERSLSEIDVFINGNGKIGAKALLLQLDGCARDFREAIEKLTTKTGELEKVLLTSQMAIKVGTWIVAAFGVSIIALIWALITGQATLSFQ